jgi:hypothetical protein
MMKTRTLIRISGMVLLAVAVSIAMLALVYILQNPAQLTSVSWIG